MAFLSERDTTSPETPRFKVPLMQRLKFLVSLMIHFIGSNKPIQTGLPLPDTSPTRATPVPLRTRAASKSPLLIMGTALGKVPENSKATIVTTEFNSITPENALKWGCLLQGSQLGTYDFSRADQIVEYARHEKLNVRGHALLWGKLPGMGYPANLPEVLNAEKNPRTKLREIVENHLFTVLSRYRGKINVWDVVNEPFELSGSQLDNNVFSRHRGTDYIEESFIMAHSIDPSLRLVLNEQIDHYGGLRARRLLALLDQLLKAQAPVHTLGIQSHLLFDLPSPGVVKLFLRKLSDLGLSFEVTEFDLRIGLFKYSRDPYQAQADYARRLVDVFMGFPNFLGLTFWSCFDDDNWMDKTMPFGLMKPNSASLYDKHLTKKPFYHAMADSLSRT